MVVRKLSRCLTVCILAWLAPPARAHGQSTLGAISAFYGTRSLSMGGAHRGLASGNDAVFVNQAAMAMERRYSAEGQFTTGGDHVARALLSTVDSKTASLAAGVAYSRTWGNPSGMRLALNQFNMALAWAPLPVWSIGLGAVNVSGHSFAGGQTLRVNQFNATLSTMLSLARIVSAGLSWENFIPVAGSPSLTPRALGVGGGFRAGLFSLGADVRIDMAAKGVRAAHGVDVGGEVLLLQFLALRAGWRLVPNRHDVRAPREHVVAAGLGATLGGGGLECGLEKALAGNGWRMAVGLQFLM